MNRILPTESAIIAALDAGGSRRPCSWERGARHADSAPKVVRVMGMSTATDSVRSSNSSQRSGSKFDTLT